MNKFFRKELSKLDSSSKYPGQEKISLASLYGPLQIHDSQYIFAWTPRNHKNKIYIVNPSANGETPRDVYDVLRENFEGKAKKLLDKTKGLSSLDIFIGKKLNLPEGLGGKPNEIYDDDHMRRLIRIVKSRGVSIGGEIVIDINAWAGPYKALNAEITMRSIILENLHGIGFERREMPKIAYTWKAYGPGDADAEVRFLTGDCYIGELKSVQTKLPCGRTFSGAKRNFDKEWSKLSSGSEDGVDSFLNFIASGDPNIEKVPVIECGYKKGWKRCAPYACYIDSGAKLFLHY